MIKPRQQQLRNLEKLVTKCERIEAAFRAIRREPESLPKSHLTEGLLRQNALDISAAVKSTKIAHEALKQEKAGLN